MYKVAYKYSDKVVFYFDSAGNKYVATGGSLAWRINNPGLVHSHTRFSRRLGSIGSFGPYAIFSHPQEGRKALAAWIHSKKYFNSSFKALAEHYQPKSPDAFISQLSSLSKIPPETKIKLLNQQELSSLLISLEKLCGYASTGNEAFSLLPKIIAKIENVKGKEDTYLIGNNIVLSKKEAVEWIQSHRLDGVIVHEHNDAVHLRSRPNHCIQNLDAMLDLDSTNPKTIETYTKQRMKHYEKEFSKISNVTVLDPDPKWKHRFSSSCYQAAVQMITKKYGRP